MDDYSDSVALTRRVSSIHDTVLAISEPSRNTHIRGPVEYECALSNGMHHRSAQRQAEVSNSAARKPTVAHDGPTDYGSKSFFLFPSLPRSQRRTCRTT
jgi:hypothetical protein